MINLEEAVGVREGDVVAGKYRIDRVLGAGAMGVVVAAHHAQLDTRVAIKLLWPSKLGDSEAHRRFAREARATAKIGSEHVARVLDVGALENDGPYMVMEFLDGVDLARGNPSSRCSTLAFPRSATGRAAVPTASERPRPTP